MRPFTLKTEIVAIDKASQNINKINAAADRMSKNVTKESTISGNAFSLMASKINSATKSAAVSLGNFNARVSQISRNVSKKVSGMLGTLGKIGVGIGLVTTLGFIANANIEVDKNMQSLSAVTGVAGAEFEGYKTKVFDASKELNMFSGDMAKAFEVIGSQKPELLASADAMKMVTKSAVILSRASGEDLASSATNLTGIMNQFQLGAMESARTIDVLAAGTIAGASSIAETGEAMKNFGTVAKSSNMTIEESVAAIQLLSLYQLKGAEAGTKARGAIIKLQQAQLGYQSGIFNTNDALKEAKTKYDKLGSAIAKDAFILDTFGIENKTTGMILMNNVGRLESMTVAVSETGKAQEMANKNMDTFSQKLIDIQNAFKNETTSVQANSSQMNSLKAILGSVATNMDKIIATVIVAVKIYAAYKIATWSAIVAQKALQAVIFAQNVVLGIQYALYGSTTIAMKRNIITSRGNAVAMWTMNAATKAATVATALYNLGLTGAIAATWAFTAALLANPITWVIVGIAALIVIIILLVKHWETVKKAVISFWDSIKNTAPIQYLIEIFQGFKNAAMQVINSVIGLFKNMWEFIKAIGGFISAVFTVAFSPIVDSLKYVWSVFKLVFSFIIDLAGKLIEPFIPFVEALKNIGTVIKTYILDKFKSIGAFVSKIIDSISKFFGDSATKINAKSEQILTVNNKEGNISEKNIKNSVVETTKNKTIENESLKTDASKKLADALNKNTSSNDENTEIQKAKKDEWKGKFYTSILKNANVPSLNKTVTNELATTKINNEKNIINEQKQIVDKTNQTELSKVSEIAKTDSIEKKATNTIINEITNESFKESEIAKTAIRNEQNVINTQKDVINESNIIENTTNRDLVKESNITQKSTINENTISKTPTNRNENKKSELVITLIDKTNNKFGITVESTGIDVIRTGNA